MNEYKFSKSNVDLQQLADEIKTALGIELQGTSQTGYMYYSSPNELKVFTQTPLTPTQMVDLASKIQVHSPKPPEPRKLKLKSPSGTITEFEVVQD